MPVAMRSCRVLPALFLLALATPLPAEEVPPNEIPGAALGALAAEHTAKPGHGTEGLVAVPVEITNTGETALSCAAGLAHWYSQALGTVGFGATLSLTLWSDPATGAVTLLNPKGEQMAVERVWCGPAGNDWAARYELPLLRRAGQAETAQRLDCSAGAQTTACTPR